MEEIEIGIVSDFVYLSANLIENELNQMEDKIW